MCFFVFECLESHIKIFLFLTVTVASRAAGLSGEACFLQTIQKEKRKKRT
jgi:hypothetical protein